MRAAALTAGAPLTAPARRNRRGAPPPALPSAALAAPARASVRPATQRACTLGRSLSSRPRPSTLIVRASAASPSSSSSPSSTGRVSPPVLALGLAAAAGVGAWQAGWLPIIKVR